VGSVSHGAGECVRVGQCRLLAKGASLLGVGLVDASLLGTVMRGGVPRLAMHVTCRQHRS
jgi:hypothetical protein